MVLDLGLVVAAYRPPVERMLAISCVLNATNCSRYADALISCTPGTYWSIVSLRSQILCWIFCF